MRISQKGSVLVYALLMLSVTLAISLTLTGIFVPKLRTVREAGDASVALYAADSGFEHCLFEIRKLTDSGWDGRLSNGAQFTVRTLPGETLVPGNDCVSIASASFQFRSTGTFRGVTRSLEIAQ